MDKTSRECGDRRGLGDFLRSLLSGVPWSERAEDTETHRFAPPRGGALRVDNANGRTRVVGEDRDDIEVNIRKVARAESQEGASSLLASIRLDARDEAGVLVLAFDIPGRWNRQRLGRRRGALAARPCASTCWPPTAASACRACAAPCAASRATGRSASRT